MRFYYHEYQNKDRVDRPRPDGEILFGRDAEERGMGHTLHMRCQPGHSGIGRGAVSRKQDHRRRAGHLRGP